MNILSIKDKKTTRLIIEYYYFIVFGVYLGSIFSPYIRTGVTMTIFLFFNDSICNRLLLNILQVISQKYGLNL